MLSYFKSDTRTPNAAEKLLAQTNATKVSRETRVAKIVPDTVAYILAELQSYAATELKPTNMKVDLEKLFESGDLLGKFRGNKREVPGPTKIEFNQLVSHLVRELEEPTKYGFKVTEIINHFVDGAQHITIMIDWTKPVVPVVPVVYENTDNIPELTESEKNESEKNESEKNESEM